jgi:hypothetical protein
MEVLLPSNNDPTKHICPRRRGFKLSLAHHWSELVLEIRHQFHTSVLLSNWIFTNQHMPIWNLGSNAFFEYTSCNFKVVTLFIRNLFRVRLQYLLLIRKLCLCYLGIKWENSADYFFVMAVCCLYKLLISV